MIQSEKSILKFKTEAILYLIASFSTPMYPKSCLACKKIVLNSIKSAAMIYPVNKFKERGTHNKKIPLNKKCNKF